MEIFYSSDRYMGGCIWEWCEHALTLYDGDTKYFGYGGDFGDNVSYKNICVDGVCSPDRRTRSAMLEMKNVYAPVLCTLVNDKPLEIDFVVEPIIAQINASNDYSSVIAPIMAIILASMAMLGIGYVAIKKSRKE